MTNEEGKIKADPSIKAILKERKFKWKTLINDSSTGSRYELLEVQNTEYPDQMRKSRATLFRPNLKQDDILKEPLSIYFSTMVVFGELRNPAEDSSEEQLIHSQANIISNLMLYKYKSNEEEVKKKLSIV